jgi:hypothetical protein
MRPASEGPLQHALPAIGSASYDYYMKHQLIPPPELAPPSVRHLSVAQKAALWAAMVEEGDQIVLCNLREKLGPDGDVQGAFREWLTRRMADHDRATVRMITEMRRRERNHAG